MEYAALNTGARMPMEGFGVFQIPDAAECERVVYDAIRTGYRSIDTAAAYMNEEAVGRAVRRAVADGRVRREELFITTKVWVQDQKTEETAYEAVRTPLKKLDMDYVDLMKNLSIVPEAWGPLAGGKHGIFTDPVLTEIVGKYGKTAAQVALRWNVQRGVVIILKSTHVEHMEQNLDIWDFSLTDEEMAKISAKDLGRSEIVDHSDPAFVKMILDWNIHD